MIYHWKLYKILTIRKWFVSYVRKKRKVHRKTWYLMFHFTGPIFRYLPH